MTCTMLNRSNNVQVHKHIKNRASCTLIQMYVPAAPATPSSLTLSGLLARMVASLFTSPLCAAEQADFRNLSSSKFWLAGAALVWQLHLRCSWQSMLLAVISTTSLVSQITQHRTLDACTAALRSYHRGHAHYLAEWLRRSAMPEKGKGSSLRNSASQAQNFGHGVSMHSSTAFPSWHPAESGPCITKHQ